MLKMKSIPNSFIENNDMYRILHTNDFEVHFSNINKMNKKELFDIYGTIGVKMSTNSSNKKILLYLNSENKELKNQVISYILGYFNFKKLNTSIATSYSNKI